MASGRFARLIRFICCRPFVPPFGLVIPLNTIVWNPSIHAAQDTHTNKHKPIHVSLYLAFPMPSFRLISRDHTQAQPQSWSRRQILSRSPNANYSQSVSFRFRNSQPTVDRTHVTNIPMYATAVDAAKRSSPHDPFPRHEAPGLH
jgi:hypothetical protein